MFLFGCILLAVLLRYIYKTYFNNKNKNNFIFIKSIALRCNIMDE